MMNKNTTQTQEATMTRNGEKTIDINGIMVTCSTNSNGLIINCSNWEELCAAGRKGHKSIIRKFYRGLYGHEDFYLA